MSSRWIRSGDCHGICVARKLSTASYDGNNGYYVRKSGKTASGPEGDEWSHIGNKLERQSLKRLTKVEVINRTHCKGIGQ